MTAFGFGEQERRKELKKAYLAAKKEGDANRRYMYLKSIKPLVASASTQTILTCDPNVVINPRPAWKCLGRTKHGKACKRPTYQGSYCHMHWGILPVPPKPSGTASSEFIKLVCNPE